MGSGCPGSAPHPGPHTVPVQRFSTRAVSLMPNRRGLRPEAVMDFANRFYLCY